MKRPRVIGLVSCRPPTRVRSRAIAPWITVQLAVALGLGFGLAQAMRPAVAQSLRIEEFDYPLRLSEDGEARPPLPLSLRDGFSFGLGGER